MTLLTLTLAKQYIRAESTVEDAILGVLLAAATAVVRGYLRRSIEAEAREFILEDPRASALDRAQLSRAWRAITFLRIPDSPIDLALPVTIVDRDGVTLDATAYRVTAGTGMVRSVDGFGFGCGFAGFPYTITATTGLATRDDYDDVVEPAINAAIGDVFADLAQRRNPAATAERAAGGDAVTYGRIEETIPRRAVDLISAFRAPSL